MIAAAATTDTTIQIPTNAIVLRVDVTVMVAIPTATSFDYGVAGATQRYGKTIGVSAFTNCSGTGGEGVLYAAPTAIRFTPQATPGAASGRVLTVIYYYSA